ncbi:MAG: phenylalanine--tRNA ligase subunit alpha [Actinomycetota bacterium]
MDAAQLLDEIGAAEAEALASVEAADDTEGLAAIEPGLFGKTSTFGRLKSGMGQLAPDDRKQVGRALNEARTRVTSRLGERRDELGALERRAQLEDERMDLTEVSGEVPVGHRHLLSQAHRRLEDVFTGMGFTIAEGPEVETDWMNFGALNFADDHPARDMQDTLYVDWGKPESTLLRTHTSPVQMRTMLAGGPPIYVVCPGRVYRRDTADATHMPVFHQIEGLVIDRNITFADLAGTLDEFTRAYFGADIETRLRPSYFPFTEPSAEYDITDPRSRTGWLELGGCGMVHPNVLRNGGIDPEEWSGFAFGFGTDRLAMMRHGITMLRELWANDVRFLRQF